MISSGLLGIVISRSLFFVKRVLKYPLALVGFINAHVKNKPSGIRVLMYHRVNPYAFADLSVTSRSIRVTPEQFEAQLAYLQAKNYRTIGLDALSQFTLGNEPIGGKELLITFDDGYEDNMLWAAPLLAKYGFTAVFFLVTDFMETGEAKDLWYEQGSPTEYRRFLKWPQVSELIKQGFSIGSHSCRHLDLDKVSESELEIEMRRSKECLETRLAVPVTSFAYPRGKYNEEVVMAAEKAGYRTAFTTVPGINGQHMNALRLKRTVIAANDDLFLFKCKLDGYLDWLAFKERPKARKVIDQINKVLLMMSGHKSLPS